MIDVRTGCESRVTKRKRSGSPFYGTTLFKLRRNRLRPWEHSVQVIGVHSGHVPSLQRGRIGETVADRAVAWLLKEAREAMLR